MANGSSRTSDQWKGKTPIGVDALNWYTRNVFMMPYDIPQLELMARMERARSLSFFQFEQQKNRDLPPIKPARTYKEYVKWDDETALILRRWYVEDQQILSDRDYMDDVRSEEGLYLMPFGLIAFPTTAKPGVKRILLVPPDHWRAVYSNMGFRTDPGVLHGHEYWPGHYYEGEIQRRNPCPIRRGHRDGAHSQGWCFYHEELPVHLDFPYVRGPRTRELVYINVLQRADRISLGIKLLTGQITFAEGRELMMKTVPPLGPGLGTQPEEVFEEVEGIIQRGLDHCQTGKLQIFQLLADRKMQLKDKFDLREFHDQLISMGSVPVALLRWEITGSTTRFRCCGRHSRSDRYRCTNDHKAGPTLFLVRSVRLQPDVVVCQVVPASAGRGARSPDSDDTVSGTNVPDGPAEAGHYERSLDYERSSERLRPTVHGEAIDRLPVENDAEAGAIRQGHGSVGGDDLLLEHVAEIEHAAIGEVLDHHRVRDRRHQRDVRGGASSAGRAARRTPMPDRRPCGTR